MKPFSQDWLIAAGAVIPVSVAKRLGVFLLPLDGMLVHRRSPPSNLLGFPQQFAGTHLYSWVERGTVRVKCLAQEHNAMSPARARTWTARSGDERTNHEATAPCHPEGSWIFYEVWIAVYWSLLITKVWFTGDFTRFKHRIKVTYASILNLEQTNMTWPG